MMDTEIDFGKMRRQSARLQMRDIRRLNQPDLEFLCSGQRDKGKNKKGNTNIKVKEEKARIEITAG